MSTTHSYYIDNMKLARLTGSTIYTSNFTATTITSQNTDGWSTNWATSYMNVLTGPNRLRVSGQAPNIQRNFSVAPNDNYELTYTQSENNSVTFVVEQSPNGSSGWNTLMNTTSANGTQTKYFTPSQAYVRVRVSGSAAFSLSNMTLVGTHSDTSYTLIARGGYRYGFNGQERVDEVSGKGNSYTAEFWQYSPRLGKRWNIDPVVKPHRSPYDVFSNNPIIRIDPNGADDYKVNRKGNFTLKKKTSDDFDKLIGRTQKGFRKSTQIEKGIMSSNSHHNVTLERNSPTEENKDNKETIDYKIDTYVGSAKETQKLFEFLGATTDVEWSLYKFNEGGVYPHSILTTSHDESTDVSGHIIINNPLFKESDFNGHDHIHPGGSKTPSGYYDSRELNPRGSGDVGFARRYRAAFLRQVKNRVLTLKSVKEYEKVKIYRSPDLEGAKRPRRG
jgi:hypothetical protein